MLYANRSHPRKHSHFPIYREFCESSQHLLLGLDLPLGTAGLYLYVTETKAQLFQIINDVGVGDVCVNYWSIQSNVDKKI